VRALEQRKAVRCSQQRGGDCGATLPSSFRATSQTHAPQVFDCIRAHGQRISHAIVMTDALNICEGTTKLKKRLLMQSRAD